MSPDFWAWIYILLLTSEHVKMNNSQLFLNILVLSEFDNRNANVIRDFLFSFNKYSRHRYYYRFDPQSLDSSFDPSAYDVILLFWSIYYPGAGLSGEVRQKIARSSACKVLFLQDEYRNVRMYNQVMNDLGIELMFTCVAEKDHKIFYPPARIPSLQATYTVLTGYVPSYLGSQPPDFDSPRPIDVAYRSRSLPYYLGDLAREKTVIAQKFQEISQTYGFRADISVREEDRIYGDAWVEFLKSARFVLGSASGASVIDFSGDIGRNCENYLAIHPEASYEDVKQRFFADVDGKLVIDTVSPRIFESTALGCTMVMHEGYYGGILEPGKHYICVKKDYSNIQGVVAQMRDESYCKEIARYAYHDLIASGKYSYQAFASWFDHVLDKHIHPTARPTVRSKFLFYARNYIRAGETLVPSSDHVYSLPFRNAIQKYRLMRRSLQHVSICLPCPPIRMLLGKYILNKRFGKRNDGNAEPKPVLMDLTRLSILWHIVRGQKAIRGTFQVRLDYDSDASTLRFVSDRPEEKGDSSLPATIHAGTSSHSLAIDAIVSGLSQGRILLEWDHSNVSPYLDYFFRQARRSLDMGFDGHYRFLGMSVLARQFPTAVTDVLRSIITAL